MLAFIMSIYLPDWTTHILFDIKNEIYVHFFKNFIQITKNFLHIIFQRGVIKIMQIFEYTVTATEGLKAYDASRLIQIAAESGCTVTLEKGGKTVNAKKLFAVMGLGIKNGDKIKLTVSGSNENETAESIKSLLLETV